MEGGAPITYTIAVMAGLVYVEIPALIQIGIVARYLEDDDIGDLGLSAKGQRWSSGICSGESEPHKRAPGTFPSERNNL